MRKLETAWVCEGREDRAAVFEYAEGLVLVVADGAGGTGGGARSAQAVVDAVHRAGWSPHSSVWVDLLGQLDPQAGPGQTTAVVVALGKGTLTGASVGDSGAWWFSDAGEHELTRAQHRKPLVGSGEARPVGFVHEAERGGTLVVASDGLWTYVPWARLPEALRGTPEEAARALVDLVRYPSGTLPDDVAIIVCRLSASPSALVSSAEVPGAVSPNLSDRQTGSCSPPPEGSPSRVLPSLPWVRSVSGAQWQRGQPVAEPTAR